MNKERLLPRRREGEAAGPAVQMEVGYTPIFNLVVGNYLKFEVLQFSFEKSGRSAAWLARLPWEQEVGRSNRLAPTNI
jgi:hypothetical protein